MLKSKISKTIIIIAILIVSAVIVSMIPVFEICPPDTDILTEENSDDAYIIKYTYTTGAGWIVVDGNAPELIGQYAAIYSAFDPRLLKDNKTFDMDYSSKVAVIADSITDTIIDGESVKVIHPNRMIILYNTEKQRYRLIDMSMNGILKSIIGCFNHQYRLSY